MKTNKKNKNDYPWYDARSMSDSEYFFTNLVGIILFIIAWICVIFF